MHHTPTDCPDWLSPMLVKELRQGLKTKVFVTAFIVAQVVMVGLLGCLPSNPNLVWTGPLPHLPVASHE